MSKFPILQNYKVELLVILVAIGTKNFKICMTSATGFG